MRKLRKLPENVPAEDITISAQMILSCVVRVRETLGYYVGKTLIVQTLRGSRDRRLLQLGLDRLSTYGLMQKLSAEKVLAMIDRLEEAGYLRTNAQHFTLEPTAAANGVLFGGEKVAMPVHFEPAAQSGEKTPPEEARQHPPRRPARTVSSRRSRRSARASLRRRACLPMLYSPTRRLRTWRRKPRARRRIFWKSPASAR